MMSAMSVVMDSILRFQALLKKPIVAIDPGPRRCGISSLAPCEIGGLYLNYTRQEPLLSIFDREKADKINARTMTDIETASVAANFVRQISEDIGPCEVYLENQPPAAVTGKSGRTTRTLSLAFISAFTTQGWPVTMKTVKTYKERTFGIIVYPKDNWSNKRQSTNFIRQLCDRYPILLVGDELKIEADICDSLILLFSRVIELVALLPICQLIDPQKPLQVLEAGLLLIQLSHQTRSAQPWDEKEILLNLNRIKSDELNRKCCELLIVASVEKRAVRSKSTRPKKVAGTHGVPIVPGTHASHLIIPLPPTTISSPPTKNENQK